MSALTLCLLLAAPLQGPLEAPGAAPEAAPARPNLVFAIADDWGWPHAGAYGDRAVATPAFDRVAREGALFEQAFVSSPSCTPSRGAILTGQHFFRLGAGANLWNEWPQGQFAEYPALLEAAGYHVGSWRKAWGPGKGAPAGKKYKGLDDFLEARPEGAPFCFWFGAWDPHRGYEAGSGVADGIRLEDVHLFGHFPDDPIVRSDVADYYFEVQRFDRDVGRLLERLEAIGELDNTLVLVTGDHGMPFPRCKGNVHDSGSRVPLAARWGDRLVAGQTVRDLVSLTDVAPTFLEAAGLDVPGRMTGRSLLPLMTRIGEEDFLRTAEFRDRVLIGRERHVPCQEAPLMEGYPVRALRTSEYLLVHNLFPDRWPAGTPDHERCATRGSWLGDCDNGPTKLFLWEQREDPEVRPYFDLCFSKRPQFELYDLASDPMQVKNLADDPAHGATLTALQKELAAALLDAADPRSTGAGAELEGHRYLGGGGGKWPYR
ncbi:MAG: sulfatase [Planctomycetota bacterium]|jgi:arylsulfatase A-like enzyme